MDNEPQDLIKPPEPVVRSLSTGLPSMFANGFEIRGGQLFSLVTLVERRAEEVLPYQPFTIPTHVLKEFAEMALKQIAIIEGTRQ